jgi:hypothetical protein
MEKIDETLEILRKFKNDTITENEAIKQILHLFDVSVSFCPYCKEVLIEPELKSGYCYNCGCAV